MAQKLFIIAAFVALGACTAGQFNGQSKNGAAPQSEPANSDIDKGQLAGPDCSPDDHDKCLEKRKSDGAEASYRVIDCAKLDQAKCQQAVQQAIARDGDLEGTRYVVKDCQPTSCKAIGNNFPGKDVVVAGADGSIIDAEGDGTHVLKVGINFEDLWDNGKSDNDYNDAVLCFSGKFSVKDRSITSLIGQTVSATTSSISGCQHTITAVVTDNAGKKIKEVSYDSRSKDAVSLPFTKGATLSVFMEPTGGPCSRVKVAMTEPKAAIVQPDVCNTSGE